MLLGYAKNTKGYKVYDLETHKVQTSRTTKLDEREVGSIYEGNVSNNTVNDTTAIPYEDDADDDLHYGMHNSGKGDVEMKDEHEDGDGEMDKQMSDIGPEDESVSAWPSSHQSHSHQSQQLMHHQPRPIQDGFCQQERSLSQTTGSQMLIQQDILEDPIWNGTDVFLP
ncbi:unnamed protein product [Albugo candida]|uniref:Retroviral polymerase SH3-like domain-containing protein n=1 Tax=Albugo candida TaxID=65357 RepID=A0A024FUC7_9STRA|nr:unnamed protein product [Albugo candida]|eukprot:CCI10763.1 unnamed protein product [Albugo candida]